MKISTLSFLLGLFLSSFALAKTKGFEVQFKEISINGSIDAKEKKFTVVPNQPVVVSRSVSPSGVSTNIEMTVLDDSTMIKDGILVKLSVIEEINGQKKIIGTPQMIGRSGHEMEMTEAKADHTPIFTAILTSKRL